MSRTQEMIQSHPRQLAADQDLTVPADELASAIEALYGCAEICTACADACLGEQDVASLTRCIRTDLDCADVCRATAAILTRQTDTDWELVRAQLGACVTACRSCARECQKHADHHDHCRICAETCSECDEACNRILNSLHA